MKTQQNSSNLCWMVLDIQCIHPAFEKPSVWAFFAVANRRWRWRSEKKIPSNHFIHWAGHFSGSIVGNFPWTCMDWHPGIHPLSVQLFPNNKTRGGWVPQWRERPQMPVGQGVTFLKLRCGGKTEDPRISPHVSRLEILGLKQLSSVSAVYQRVYLDDVGDYIKLGFKYT